MTSPIKTLYDQWQACQPLPDDNATALWQWVRMRFNHLSNSFEGNTLTYNETQLLLIHGRTTGDHELREYEEMKAHNVAFEHIRTMAEQDRGVNEADIRNLNQICLKEPFYAPAQTPDGEPTRKWIVPGEYKKMPNHVLTSTGEVFHYATPEETPAAMADFTEWLQNWLHKDTQEQHAGVAAFLAELHHRFIRIHPFDDGNGRVVRLLMAYILIRLGYLPMVLQNRNDYIKAIQFADAGGDLTQLEALFTTRITEMLQTGIDAKTTRIELNGNGK